MMGAGLTFSITAVAELLAAQMDDDNLALTAVAFSQLADTLETILTQRTVEKDRDNPMRPYLFDGVEEATS